jgi:glycosyltransferase involved in cell wall biosynthesis
MANGFQYKQSASDRATENAYSNNASIDHDSPANANERAKIAFIERKYWRKDFLAFSIEKVFEQIARLLDPDKFAPEFMKVPHGNSPAAIVKNLLRFKKTAADIYHITGQIHYMALVLPKDRTVLTIHDLAFLEATQVRGIRRFLLTKIFLDLPIKRARCVTAVSETTKKAIVKNSRCASDKVRVIHDPVQQHYLSGKPKEFNKSYPTILQIGITENKNIERLVGALKGIPCRLKIVGNMTDRLSQTLNESGIDHVSVMGLDDAQMKSAYEDADMVSFCSTYEGFGLPIIEAQAMYTPVLTSDLDPMREVSGGAAYLADPFDVESIRKGILTIINDDQFREQIIEQGRENIQRFLPNKIAVQYEQLYDEVLAG